MRICRCTYRMAMEDGWVLRHADMDITLVSNRSVCVCVVEQNTYHHTYVYMYILGHMYVHVCGKVNYTTHYKEMSLRDSKCE